MSRVQDRANWPDAARLSALESDMDETRTLLAAAQVQQAAALDKIIERLDVSDENTNAKFGKVTAMSIGILTALLTIAGAIVASVLALR